MSALNLYTTIDRHWLPYACMMIASVRDNYRGNLCYKIVHEDIDESRQQAVTAWATRRDIHLHFVDMRRIASALGVELGLPAMLAASGPSLTTHWGRYFGRLFFAPDQTRAVYADVDMLALKPIDGLDEVYLSGCPVGAVSLRCEQASRVAAISIEEYCNNGLLVFDLDVFDGVKCVEAMRAGLMRTTYVYGPQCAFNVAMSGRIKKLGGEWNVQGEQREEIGDRARLVHFTGLCKPWSIHSQDPLRDVVRHYLKVSPFPEAWEKDWSLSGKARALYRRLRFRFSRFQRTSGLG